MNLFEKEKLLSNPLYFIAVNGVPDPEKEKRLETEFMADLSSYFIKCEKDSIAEFFLLPVEMELSTGTSK